MRILFVTPVVPSPSYGRRPYNFIRYLCREHRVYVATFLTDEKRDPAYLRQLAEWGVIVRTVPHPRWRGALNCARGLYRLEPLRSLWVQSRPLEKVIAEFLHQYPIEVAHFDRMRMGHFALGLKGAPRVVDFTDALMLYLDRTRTPYRSTFGRLIDAWERRMIPRYEAKVLSSVEASLCCSPVDQEVFRRYHPAHPVEVIPNTVDSEHFHPRRREDSSPSLVFTGTFSYFPNLDSLFYFMEEIWPPLRRRFPALSLDVIGARPPRSVEALGSKPGIRVLANVPDMAEHLYGHDLFICPLRVAAGLRNKVLEAMAAGMTVISSPIGVEGLSVRPGIHYLQAESAEDFIEQIGWALGSPEGRQRLGEAARRYVMEYHSGEAAGRALLYLYKKVIENRRNVAIESVDKKVPAG